MKNLYDISLGQLFTVMVFGVIGTIWALIDQDSYRPSDYSAIIAWLLSFAVIFYSIGWRNHHRNNK